MVVPPHRDGGQAQQPAQLRRRFKATTGTTPHAWLLGQPAGTSPAGAPPVQLDGHRPARQLGAGGMGGDQAMVEAGLGQPA